MKVTINIDGPVKEPQILREYLFGGIQRAKRAGAVDEDAEFKIELESE